jgi:hypothetical protein
MPIPAHWPQQCTLSFPLKVAPSSPSCALCERPDHGVRVLTVTFCSDFAVPLACAEDVRRPALLTKVPTLVAVRALVPRSLAGCAMVFRGTSSEVADGRHVGSGRGRRK